MEEVEPEEPLKQEEPVPETQAEQQQVEVKPSTQQQDSEPVQSIKSNLFAKFATSVLPAASHIPNAPVFFAPGSKTSPVAETTPALERETTQTMNMTPQAEHPPAPSVHACPPPEPMKSEQLPERKARPKNQFTNPQDRLKPSSQCNYPPVINPLMPPNNEPVYPPALQSATALNEAYTKLQDHEIVQSRPPPPLNTFENPNAYNYNLLDELSQNMNKVTMDSRPGKADAFTQPDTTVPPSFHSMQQTKPTAPQPVQMAKSVSTMPQSTNQQSLPTTQPQMHPAVHATLPQLLNHFQASFPMFNLPSGSAAAPSPHMFDMDQLTALHQQRLMFEMQQQSQQQQQQQQPPQTVATEPSLHNTSADVLSSSKSNMPMHHVTTANVGTPITFLPYPGMVFMVSADFQLITPV